MEVGFLGLGIRGKTISLNLLHNGFKVTVWNRTLSKGSVLGFLDFFHSIYNIKYTSIFLFNFLWIYFFVQFYLIRFHVLVIYYGFFIRISFCGLFLNICRGI